MNLVVFVATLNRGRASQSAASAFVLWIVPSG